MKQHPLHRLRVSPACGWLKGGIQQLFQVKLNLRKATIFDKHHPQVAQALRYFKIRIVINAVQICMRTALAVVPKKRIDLKQLFNNFKSYVWMVAYTFIVFMSYMMLCYYQRLQSGE